MARKATPVLQYDPAGHLIARHESTRLAALSIGAPPSSIATALNYREQYPIKGFVWRKEGMPFRKARTPHA